MEASFGRFYLVLQSFAGGFNILSLCTDLFRKKKMKTNNKTNSKQAKSTKQTRENSDKLFLTVLSFFIYVL